MSSNFNAIDGAVYEPEAKILDIYRKTTAEFMVSDHTTNAL